MSQVERVNAAWNRIEKWYAEKAPDIELGAVAAAADITAVETHLGLALPEELKASLMRHNGVKNWPRGELLSVGRIKNDWDDYADLLDEGTFDDILGKENDFIQKCWWNKSWVPIDADGNGNLTFLDLNPGSKGVVGQVIYMDQEEGPSLPLFADFAAYLENTAEMLEGGKYVQAGHGNYTYIKEIL